MERTPGNDISVLDLNTRVRELFQTVFPYPVWVRGSLSGRLQTNQRGHTYFQLLDSSGTGGQPAASIDCVLFAGARAGVQRDFARIGRIFEPAEGMNVRVLGRVDLWPQSGRFQFVVDTFDPFNFGSSAELHLRTLVEKLTSEGLASRNPSLGMPILPLRIGLISAPGSAALEDFLTTLRESGYPFEVFFHPAQMQGVMTARSVMEALSRLGKVREIDVAVITRGGGSGSDLSWFNSEPLGRAIARAPWPVISGIGHEVDFTLPDFIAHTRAKTPTHAASMLVDRVADAAGSIDGCAATLASTVLPRLRTETFRLRASASLLMSGVTSLSRRAAGMLDRNGVWLEAAASRRISDAKGCLHRGTKGLVSRGVPAWLAGSARSLDLASQRVTGASSARLDIAGRRIDALSAVVSAREPARMMALGWAVVRNEEGAILHSVTGARIGARIGVQLRDGSITARTESMERERAPEGPPDPRDG